MFCHIQLWTAYIESSQGQDNIAEWILSHEGFISNHLARPEDLPDLGEIEIYDYDSDLTVASQQSMDVLETLAAASFPRLLSIIA